MSANQPDTKSDTHIDVRITDADQVRHIELDRPRSKNGLTRETNQAVIDAIAEANEHPDIRVILLSGRNGTFCSGLDLKAAMRAGPQSPEASHESIDTYFHGLIRALVSSPRPTIAAIDGAAAGFGADLALACDIRLMSERARFGEIFVLRGLIPDGGSTYHLPRLIGVGKALELMLTGDIIDAPYAERLGLCNHVYPTYQLMDEAWNLARRLAAGPPRAHRLIKECVRASLGGTLEDALVREREGQVQCLQSKDFFEGVAAFIGKRAPKFSGE